MAVEVRIASLEDIPAVQKLWREYWRSLGLPGDFQSFDEECQSLPGVYSPPKGRLLLAVYGGKSLGTAALRPLNDHACEAKRLYVRPIQRGMGLGRILLARLIQDARLENYEAVYADTLPSLTVALSLYKGMGFVEVGPYSANPTPGAIYLKLELAAGDRADD